MKNFSVSLLLWIFALSPFAIKAQSIEKAVDSLISRDFNDKNVPGGVFMNAHQGKPVYQKAFGKANLELGDDMSVDNVFELGSMTKQFTAVAILMLEQQGKLNVGDRISKYIPDYPNADKIKYTIC